MTMQNNFDILSCQSINRDFVIDLTKDNIESIDQKAKQNCKILKFSSEWSFEEVVVKIPNLDFKSYPLLFIFVIDIKSDDFCGSLKFLKSSLASFTKNRAIILQLTSEHQKLNKIYYKEENFEDFCVIKEVNFNQDDSDELSDFSSFLWLYLNKKINNFENVMLEKLPKVKNSSIIIKFLRTQKLSENFFNKLVLYATCGTENDLISAIDGYYNEKGEIIGFKAEHYLSNKILSTSVLYTSIQNVNQPIVKFLLQKCCFWIQKLPFDHQIEISTAAFNSGQVDNFCELLKSFDFPFPNDFDPKPVTQEKLIKIINDRIQFHVDVLAENRLNIKKFMKSYPKLKLAFNLKNKSAMSEALNEKKFKSFAHLKASRFRDNEIENLNFSKLSNEDDKKAASKFAYVQLRKNVSISNIDDDLSVLQLATKSLIFNRDKKNPKEQEQREIIKKWFREIYKTSYGSKLIDAAIQCKGLKIIFDFECLSTENVDVASSSGSLGVTYPDSKWIFIGAKLTGEQQREQRIKGVISHEICHYVMRLVYQNQEKPYYADDEKQCEKFEEIATAIHTILFPQEQKNKEDEDKSLDSNGDEEAENIDKNKEIKKTVNDKCDGIISTVYTHYQAEDCHAELIVRPPQIQAQYDDNEGKLKELEEFYQRLFKFFEQFVIPEIEKFCLEKRGNIQGFNDWIGILCELKESAIKDLEKININEVLNNNLTIITTNIPKLLLLDIYSHFAEKYKDLMDVKNIFINPQNLEKPATLKKLNIIVKEESNLNIIADCTKGFGTNLELNSGKDSKLILVTLTNMQNDKKINKIKEKYTNQGEMAINYNWKDLTENSQKDLLQTKVNFQNNSTFSLSELILNKIDAQQPALVSLECIIDDQLLNLLLEKSEIKINQQVQETNESKKFGILFQARNLIKKYKIIEEIKTINATGIEDNVQRDINRHSVITKDLAGRNLTQFKEIDKTDQILQDQMLEDVKNMKFVLISDKAGSGKSWILKNFENKLQKEYPQKWITLVDLKQYIQQFKAQEIELEFASFMAEKILNPKSKFEAEIFKKLYENGKICILFDGFDEIAPDCAEFVTQLFQSFQQNGENQLWIATRDYFEIDLKEKLKLDAVYNLDEFTEEFGSELIAISWILSENELEFIAMAESDVITKIKTSQQFQDYKKKATKMIEKIPKNKKNSIGHPQFYKMVADITQKNKEAAINFGMFKIFEECVDIQCKKWSHEKGELRKKESVKSHDKGLNYQTLHQLVAIKSLFPGESQYCDLNIEELEEWIDEEIIACGMLNKIGEIFLWSHETFREYFVAKFILRILMKPEKRDDDQVCEYLIQVFKIEKFGIIRLFLNEALAEKSILMKIEKKIPKICENFSKNVKILEDLDYCFWEKLENLGNLLIKIFENGNYLKMKEIVLNNNKIYPASTNSQFLFDKFKKFAMNFLNENAFREFMIDNEVFLQIFKSDLDEKIIKGFLKETEDILDANFVKKSLQIKDDVKKILFFYLIKSENFSSDLFQKVIQILNIYLNINEIIEFIKERNHHGYNILHECIWLDNTETLEALWNSLELFYKSENLLEEFKRLLYEKTSNKEENVLHLAVFNKEPELHQTFWRLLLNTFENRDELKDLIMQGDKYGDNFVHYLVISSEPEIIEFTITKIKENFSSDQYKEILMSKGFTGRNLLQRAACSLKDIKTHQILWKIFRDFCNSDEEFLKFLKEDDDQNSNVFHFAAYFTTKEIFEFMIDELKKLTKNEEIKNILGTLGMANRNLFQSAARQNKSVELHEYLWTIMKEYFNPQEILDMVKHVDEFGYNLLLHAAECNTKEVLELTWTKITNFFDKTSIYDYLKAVRNNQENILHILIKSKDLEKIEILWTELKKYLTSQEMRKLFSQKATENGENVLHYAANCDKIEFHKTFCELLLNTSDNQNELKDLIMQGDENGDNFAHYLVMRCKSDVIEFYFGKFKKFFNVNHFEDILKSKGFSNTTFLQSAACFNNSLEVHKILWKIYRETFDNSQMFEIIKHIDEIGNNLLMNAVEENTEEVVRLIWFELREILVFDEEFSQKLSNQLEKFEEHLTIVMKNVKDLQELEIMRTNWNKLVKNFELIDSQKEMKRILRTEKLPKGIKRIHRFALCEKLDDHEALWQILLNSFENLDDLKDLIFRRNFNDNNFLHVLISIDNPDIFELTLKILKNSFNDEQFGEILQSKGELKRNLLQIAANKSKNVKIHQILWKIYQNFCKSNEEFLEILKQVDKNGSNVFHIAVSASTAEILEFMIKSLDTILRKEDIMNLLLMLGFANENILHAATSGNKSLELHNELWQIIQKYFGNSEILEMIHYCDKDGDNILHDAVYWNTKEIVEFTWTQIKKFIQIKEDQNEYLSRKGCCSRNLLQKSQKNQSNDPEVKKWVENILNDYEIEFSDSDESDLDISDGGNSDSSDCSGY